MKVNSKVAIYKLKKFNSTQGQFYVATVVENTYNPAIPYGNKWEFTFYKCNIYTDIELEEAIFDLELHKNKLNFINISNPEKSIIRVLDFEIVNRTAWRGKDKLKDARGRDMYNEYIGIHNCMYDGGNFMSDTRKLTLERAKTDKFKKDNASLRKEIRRLNNLIDKKEDEIIEKNKKINTISIGYDVDAVKTLPEKPKSAIMFEDI